jgi:DNA polymerase I-like protein with 3'-5' exonuclease and polymerase domains
MVESPLAGVQLHLVQSLSDAMEMKRWAGERRETPLGLDTESSGLSHQRDNMRLIQLGDLRHGWAVPTIWAGAAIEIIKEYDGEFVFHHGQFDQRFIKKATGYSIPWHKMHDTLILAALADPTRPKGLKPLASRLIDRNATAGERLLSDGMKMNGWDWGTVPIDFPPYHLYAALDPVLTCNLYQQFAPRIAEECPEAYDLERSVTPILAAMMDTGIFLDREYVTANLAKIRDSITQMREWLSTVHNVSSLMSARQIDAALRNQGVEITATTKTGLPSIDKEALEAISIAADASQPARDLAKTILRARHGEKICGTYLENFLEIVGSDGAIHPSINQLPARTSRMSISDPSLQNLPRSDVVVRGAFIPRPGNVFISCDFSQVEMRLAAALSNDAGLIAAFHEADNGGRDFYSAIAGDLFGGTIDKEDPRRQAVKSMSYASLYGAGLAKQAATAGVSVAQLKPIRDAFDSRFPGLVDLARAIQAEAVSNMASDPEGRPAVRTSTGRRLPGDGPKAYALLNYKLQGEAAEQLKRAVASVASAGLGDLARLPIHDEILFECSNESAAEVQHTIVEAMTDNDRYAVPIKCESKIMSTRWKK